jgi:hypothetical protein
MAGVKQRICGNGVTKRVPGRTGIALSFARSDNKSGMRPALIGIGFIAALACAYLLTYEFPSITLWSFWVRIFVGAFAVILFGGYWMRRKHLREWASASGRIESCSLGRADEGSQLYCCIYMSSVDGARQAGELQLWDKPNRLEEIKTAVVGQQVTVRYDPIDCTKSIIEETRVNGWSLRP